MTAGRSVAKRTAVVVVLAAVLVLGWIATRVWFAWQGLDRVGFAPAAARAALESPDYTYTEPATTLAPETESESPEENTPAAGTVAESPAEFAAARLAAADEAMEVYLVLGSDQRASLGSSRRADAIMIFILPTDGSTPLLVSLPRDLYLHNPCTGGMSRINANLNGCGSYATGPEQVAVAVEDFTGVAIDHFILFTFDGFRNIINRVGGVEVCPSVPVRDANVDPALDLPAGCSIAGGDQALAWVRSRHTEGLIDGQWVSVASSDLVRNQRQQDVILQAMAKVADMSDISQLTAIVEELAGNFTIDDGLSLSDAISHAWNLRSLDLDSVARPVLPVADYIDPDGRWVLVPRATFADIVVAANPLLAPYFAPAE